MTKKWYKIKDDISRTNEPLLAIVALLFEALNIKIDNDRFKKLSPFAQFLFEEVDPPKKSKLTKIDKTAIN